MTSNRVASLSNWAYHHTCTTWSFSMVVPSFCTKVANTSSTVIEVAYCRGELSANLRVRAKTGELGAIRGLIWPLFVRACEKRRSSGV